MTNADKLNPAGDPAVPIIAVTLENFAEVALEAPLGGAKVVDCDEIYDLYYPAAREGEGAVALRVYRLIADKSGFHFNPSDKRAPFGARWAQPAGGRRATIVGNDAGAQTAVDLETTTICGMAAISAKFSYALIRTPRFAGRRHRGLRR